MSVAGTPRGLVARQGGRDAGVAARHAGGADAAAAAGGARRRCGRGGWLTSLAGGARCQAYFPSPSRSVPSPTMIFHPGFLGSRSMFSSASKTVALLFVLKGS